LFYYLYQITNKVNNKIYVGVHKTNSLDDGYMGSGSMLKSAIIKHGILNFEKVILEYFEDSKSMYAREKEVVDDEFLLREDVYNLRAGGHGGFDQINKSGLNYGGDAGRNRGKETYRTRLKTDQIFRERISLLRSSDIITRHENNTAYRFSKEDSMEGSKKACLPEARAKRLDTFKEIGHQQGEKNSQFGKMWITNEQESKKIFKTAFIPDGWRKGRVIKQQTKINASVV